MARKMSFCHWTLAAQLLVAQSEEATQMLTAVGLADNAVEIHAGSLASSEVGDVPNVC